MNPKWEAELEAQLIHKFKIKFVISAILVAILAVFTAIVLLDSDFRSKALPLAVILPIAMVFAFFRTFWPCLQDLKAVKNRTFEKTRGKIVRFEAESSQRGEWLYPVIKDDILGEEITLDKRISPEDAYSKKVVPSMSVGERHLLLYLKHSKIVVSRKEPRSYDDE